MLPHVERTTMRAPRPLLHAVAALPLLLVGCVEPLQNGGVTIVGDPGARLGTLCRFRHGADDGFCANDAPEIKPARVRRITGPNDGLRGAFATGRAGDYLLENDEIALVIEQIGPRGESARGGALVDAADAKTRVDALGRVVASLGGAEELAVYDQIKVGTGSEGSAYVEVEGHALATPAIHLTTRYSLAPSSRVVTITTTLLDAESDEIRGLELGDAVTWGGATGGAPAAPMRSEEGAPPEAAGVAAPRESVASYIFGVGHGAAYALLKDGSPFLFRGDASSSVAVLERGVTLSPSSPLEYTRMLLVAPRGDTAALATELFYLGGGAPGGVEVAASWEGDASLRSNENRIVLHRACVACGGGAPASPFPDPPSLWLDQPADAPAAGELAPGKYTARFEGPGGSSPEVPFEVKAGAVTKLTLPVVSTAHAAPVDAPAQTP